MNMIDLPMLILASNSPRRAEILSQVGWPFTKLTADIDETPLSDETAEAYVVRLAAEKAAAVAADHPDKLVLGADTTVVVDGQIIGKPADMDDACSMIRMLAGRRHEVLTGVALVHKTQARTALKRTQVTFCEMNEDEIAFLAEKGDPLDKAGGYAVQAQAALFIDSIVGDYWNVVGLPISTVYRLANEIGAIK
jgi:septum formation protein